MSIKVYMSEHIFISMSIIVFFSLQDVEAGFAILMDRRKDKWANVRKQLAQIAVHKI